MSHRRFAASRPLAGASDQRALYAAQPSNSARGAGVRLIAFSSASAAPAAPSPQPSLSPPFQVLPEAGPSLDIGLPDPPRPGASTVHPQCRSDYLDWRGVGTIACGVPRPRALHPPAWPKLARAWVIPLRFFVGMRSA
jgi:hypothetical protein